MIQPPLQPDQRQRFGRRQRVRRDFGDNRHILARGQAGNEVIKLEDKADMLAAETGQAGVVGVAQVLAVIPDFARSRRIQPAEDVEQRRFAAAGRAEHHHKLALKQLQINAAQRPYFDIAHAVHLGQPAGAENHLSRPGFGHVYSFTKTVAAL